MKYETVAQMVQRNHDHKKAGIKHSPLHTFKECCEAAGISYAKFSWLARKYPNAPKPALATPSTTWRKATNHYRKHEFVQWVNEVLQQESTQQKGTVIMPDIKTAFENALAKTQAHIAAPIPAEWDDETAEAKIETITTQAKETTMRSVFPVTNNVSRETFNHVRDNPGLVRVAHVRALEQRGFNKSSVFSLLGQMVKQGLVDETADGKLYAKQAVYTPLKAHSKPKQKPVAQAKPKAVKPAKVETKVERVVPVNTLPEEAFDAQKFVDEMTLKQAKAVYDVLSKIFKG